MEKWSLVIGVGCLIVTLVTCGYLIERMYSHHVTDMDMCLPCEHLETSLFLDESTKPFFATMRKKYVDEKEMCCADNAGQMSAMLELIARALDQQLTNGRDFVRVGIKWNKPSGSSFEVLPTGIKIITSGVYFVHLKIDVSALRTYCPRFESQIFTGLVRKVSKGEELALLRMVHTTCCPGCFNTKEKQTAGQFYLEKGDILRVEVTSADLVKFDEHSTYLGLVLLED